ncbi:hypothetical protein K466DRAFT_526041 [Polyporus arcularius HHB13444]|uniref:SET domain-containing protein n=1 Tax=Polyporus arcularius HHB13444 TaxID=1314778 RepID=A0A5C3P8Y6_9APHY|nr:hypothetical protein K466DRAFT_526041 [Polyporus arcularius HHB13444]
MVISELKGSMADLTEEEDKELKGTNVGQAQGIGIRRDFSVIHSKQLKKNHLFLGPARFVNHDCDHNVELFREGRYITFRVIKHIGVGEEVTAHYGDGYFGRNNRHCLCATCEVNKRGGYAPQNDEDISDSASSPDSDSDNEAGWSTDHEEDGAEINVNERRTRRGVYAVLPDEEEDAADGSDADVEAEPNAAPDATSELISAPRSSSIGPAIAGPSKLNTGLLTPETETLPAESCPASVASTPRKATPAPTFIIATRAQKARAESEAASVSAASIAGKGKGKERATSSSRSASAVRQLETPPLTSDNGSVTEGPSLRSSVRLRARGDAASSASRVSTPMPDRKGKMPASARNSTADTVDLKGKGKEDLELEGRSLRRRPVVPAPVDALMAVAKKPQDGPRGVDGKLLPTCMTCHSVLPVISVEDKVVWNGLPEKTGKRGRPRKQVNQECPRCMRHYAIYAARWPDRTPSVGTPAFVPTPRENRSMTPAHLSHKHLSAVNQKLANAASGSRSASAARKPPPSNKRARPTDPDPAEAPSSKRQKVKVESASTSRHSKAKVGMSNQARKLLGVRERRSSRARVPSLKMRESEPPCKGRGASSAAGPSKAPVSTASTLSAASSSHSDAHLPTPQTPTRDRHLRSGGGDVPLPPSTPVTVKTEPGSKLPTPKSLAVASQPRETNGRFGKKASTNGRYMRKNFHFTAGGRRVPRGRKQHKPHSRAHDGADGEFKRDPDAPAGSDDSLSTSHKRTLDEGDEEEEEDRKRRRVGDESDEPRIKIEGEEGDLSMLSSERDIEEHDDDGESQDEGEPQHFRRPFLGIAKRSGGLFGRPNPLTFARRKWIKTSSMSPEDPQERANASAYSSRRSPTTDDDTDGPVTPEDDVDPPVVVVNDDDSPEEDDDDQGAESDDSASERAFVRPKLMGRPAFGGLFRPNPLNMARLRWAPTRALNADDEDAEDYATEVALSQSHTHSKTSSRTSLASFGDLFEPDEAPLDAAVTAHGSIDPGASSEEESFRPSMLSVFKPGRRSSSASSAHVDLTDDSEQSVERLVSVSDPLPSSSSSDSRPASATSLTLPVLTPPSPQKSPGMAWKQTVLLPKNVPPYKHSHHTTVTGISPVPTPLLRAGWESDGTD